MKSILKAFILASSAIALSAVLPNTAKSQTMPVCPATNTATQADMGNYPDGCKATPTRYEIVIYEMGLCTTNPLSGSSYDPSTCTATYVNPGGQSVNLAGGVVSFDLTSGSEVDRPPNGSYSHAYIHIQNVFGLRGSYQLCGANACGDGGGGTWYSDGQPSTGGTNASNAITSAVNFSETLTTFGDPNVGCTVNASETMSNGQLDALLVDNSFSATCTGASRIIGSFAPTSPLVIDDSATGMDVAFTVTENGMTIGANRNTGAIESFMSGPFNPILTVLTE